MHQDLLRDRKEPKLPNAQLSHREFGELGYEPLRLEGRMVDDAHSFCYDRNTHVHGEYQILPCLVRVGESRRYRKGYVICVHEDQEGGGYELNVCYVYVKYAS